MARPASPPILIELLVDMNGTTAKGAAILVIETGLPGQRRVRGQDWLDDQIQCATMLTSSFGFDRGSEVDNHGCNAVFRSLMRKFEPIMFGISRQKIDLRFRGERALCD